ncbi:MAG: lysylphosphatidylglycerol synthase domain-containing protein [Promethearchaeota archaeon]
MTHRALESAKALLGQRWVRHCLTLTGIGLALLVIGSTVYHNWAEFQAFSWQLNPLPLVGAGVALVLAFGLNILTWYLISRVFGSRVGFWKDLEIYSFSTVIRRLPGIIWQLAGRTYLYHQAETTLAVPLWGTLWEIFVQVSSGMLLMALMLVLSPQLRAEFPGGMWALLFLIPIGWFTLRPRDAVSLVRRIVPKMTGEPNLTWHDVSVWTGLYVLSWILGGAILYFLICALDPQPWTLLPVFAGLVATSGVLSLLAAPIPGGLGVREISLLLLLQLYVQSPVAVAAVVMLRMWLLLGEACIALFFFLLARGRVWLAQLGHNTP